MFADTNQQCNWNEEYRSESKLDRERTWGDEAAFALRKDASKPGLYVRPRDCLRRSADAKADGNQPDAGKRRKHPSGNSDHHGEEMPAEAAFESQR